MKIIDFVPEWCVKYIKPTGKTVLQNYPIEKIKAVVVNSMCGGNVREFTEPITKERIGILNAGLFLTLFYASQKFSIKKILVKSSQELIDLPRSDPRRLILQWILGLTEKQIQNVLRSDYSNVEKYLNLAKTTIFNSSQFVEKKFGKIDINVKSINSKVTWDWNTLQALLTSIGAQTLAIRGSEKSIYGKIFQYLILGSSLNLLGFSFEKQGKGDAMTYWFHSKNETRESDATAIIDKNSGMRFDIGFIGKGNPEITLDKLNRFDGQLDKNSKIDLKTIIVVDQLGEKSKTKEISTQLGVRVFEMSSPDWLIKLDKSISNISDEYTRVFNKNTSVEEIRKVVNQKTTKKFLEMILNA